LEEYTEYLEKIWASGRLTNNGEHVQLLEKELCEFLGVRYISLFCNGTIALLIAMRALELTGEVITTPYSFIATAHSIKWNGLNPVFVDIDAHDCNLDANKIEGQITKRTSGILPVHVYGNPCKMDEIQKIADQYGLKIIYDAAHAFGIRQNDRSILKKGDLSVLSFHATKIFHTIEGGAIVSHSTEMKRKIDDLKNFGFRDEVTIKDLGINGKMNEFQAVMGLLQLKYFDRIRHQRRLISDFYRENLRMVSGISLTPESPDIEYNYNYFPIFIDEGIYGKSRESVYDELRQQDIFCRRYFYPLITEFLEYKDFTGDSALDLGIAYQKSHQVLCLPLHTDISNSTMNKIISILKR